MKKKKEMSFDTLYKLFIYVALITLAVSIIVPVGWVFLASIKENSEFYGNPWTMETSFKEDLGADSLDLFELVMALEDEYSVEIPSEDLEKLATVGDVVEYLKGKGVE